MSKFSIGAVQNNNGDATVVVIGNDVIHLNSLLAATGNDVLTSGFGLSEMLDHWDVWFPRLKSVIDAFEGDVSIRNACDIGAISEVNWLPPIQRPRKLICMGTNYAGHASEVSSDPLKTPYSFIKSASNTLCGSGATITLLDIAQMNDWEVELAVVIGRTARHVEEGQAMDYVVSVRSRSCSVRAWDARNSWLTGHRTAAPSRGSSCRMSRL